MVGKIFLINANICCHCRSAHCLYSCSKAEQFINQWRLKLYVSFWHSGHGYCLVAVVGIKLAPFTHAWAPGMNTSPVLCAHRCTCHSEVTLLSVKKRFANAGFASLEGAHNGGHFLCLLVRWVCNAAVSIYPILFSRCILIICLSGLSTGGPSSLIILFGGGFLVYHRGCSPVSLIGGKVVSLVDSSHGLKCRPY